jgi:hypothetical protein
MMSSLSNKGELDMLNLMSRTALEFIGEGNLPNLRLWSGPDYRASWSGLLLWGFKC